MTEKMTVSLFAMVHGDDEALSETETWEADTKEELVTRYASLLRSMADDIDKTLRSDKE